MFGSLYWLIFLFLLLERFKSDPFDNQVSQAALMKASQIQANLKKTIGKIGVDGKLENQDMEAGDVGGYQFVPQPSPAPGKH